MRQAVALKRWLAEQDPPLANEIFLDVDPESGLHAGTRWKDALRRANARCEAVICLLSANWEASHECKVEYRTAENLNKQIFVARLEESTGTDMTSEWQRCDLFGDGARTEIGVGAGPAVEFSTEGLFRLRDGIRGAGIGADSFVWPPPSDPERAPYRGWEPLESTDAAVFFGRDAQILRALDAVRGMRLSGVNSLFVVLGPSGTGKSSFLRAGVLPRLRREDRRFVLLDIVRPERNALTGESGLAASICATRAAFGLSQPSLGQVKAWCEAGDVTAITALLSELRSSAAARLLERGQAPADPAAAATQVVRIGQGVPTRVLHTRDPAGDAAAAPTLVLPLDQAEELFSADAGATAESFLALIAGVITAINATEIGLVVAATIRTDRFELMQTHPRLAGVGSVLFDELKPMPPTQFKEVIVGPAQRATDSGRTLRIAPGLVDRLLLDAGQGADTLPMLALTLSRLYVDYGASGELTLAHYQAMGGMRRVVQTEIDEVLSADPRLRDSQLGALRAAFIPWLATINPGNDQPMRRVARLSDLPAPSRPLIEALVAKRLMVKDTRDGQAVVEVALESLLRQWDALASWLRDERKSLKDADDLERDAAAWVANRHDSAWLLEGGRLQEAMALASKPGFGQRLATLHPYLNASHQREDQRRTTEEQRRQAELRAAQERADAAQQQQATAEAHTAALRKRSRVLRAVLAGTAIVAVLAVVASAFAWVSRGQAQDRFKQATSVRLTFESMAMMNGGRVGRDDQAVQQLLAARALTPSPDAEALYDIVTKDSNTDKIIPAGVSVRGVAFSPDAELVAAGGSDGFLQIWDSRTGQTAGDRLVGNTDNVLDVAFSPNGRLLASVGADGTARVWDVQDSGLLREFGGDVGVLDAVAFGPDGTTLATGGDDGVLRIWSSTTGDLLSEIPTNHDGAVSDLAFSPDGTRVLTGGVDATARLFDLASGTAIGEPLAAQGSVNSVAFSPDGTRLATASQNAVLWDAATSQPIGQPMDLQRDYLSGVAFSPDGTKLATSSADATVLMWDGFNAASLGGGIYGHEGTIFSMAYGSDGRVVTGSRDGTVRIWNPMAGAPLVGHQGDVGGVAYSPDGDVLASAGYDGTVRLWNPDNGEPGGAPFVADTALSTVAFSPDGKLIAAGDTRGRVLLWDRSSRRLIATIQSSDTAEVRKVLFNPDGTKISIFTWGDTEELRYVDSGKLIGQSVKGITALAINPAWDVVAFSPKDSGNELDLLDLNSGKQIGDALDGHTNLVQTMVFSPDGNMLISASNDNTIRRWNVSEGKPIGEPLRGHVGAVYDVAFSPDGTRFVSGGNDTSVRIWDVSSGQQFGEPLQGHLADVTSVAFRPDGSSFASASRDGTVRIWPSTASPDELCAKLTTNMSHRQWDEWVSPDIDYVRTCPDLPVASD